MPSAASNGVFGVEGERSPHLDIKTRRKLKEMRSGRVLKVLTDYPLSGERIPRNVERGGHKVLKVERIDGPTHQILIQAGGSASWLS
jgi:TusA-related sulfurtransferase